MSLTPVSSFRLPSLSCLLPFLQAHSHGRLATYHVPSYIGIRLKTPQGNGLWCLLLPDSLANGLGTHVYVHAVFLAALNFRLLKAKEQNCQPRILAFLLLNITARALLPLATGMRHEMLGL